MPRTRGKKSHYEPSFSGDDSSEEDAMGLIFRLGLMLKQTRRKSVVKSNRKRRSGDCAGHCHCCNKPSKKARQPKGKNVQGKNKSIKKPGAAASAVSDALELDSDEEARTEVTESHKCNIENKLDSFFKALQSDDEDDKRSTSAPKCIPDKKTKDFYTLLSESEDEITSPKSPSSDQIPNTSTAGNDCFNNSVNCFNNSVISCNDTNQSTPSNTQKKDDLFTYVDDVLNECNDFSLTSDPKPTLSLEDLKKKTDDLLGEIEADMELFTKPKQIEAKNPEPLEKDVPTCPVCLEDLGGSRQAMATLCGHIYCEACIKQVINTTKKCPSCRKPLTKNKYHPIYL